MKGEKKFVVLAIVGGIVALAAIIGFAGMGNVRHVSIFWPEEVKQTLEFQTKDGKTVVVGKMGNSGTNPDLVMRTGDYTYVLTVVNRDTIPHQLYVDSVDIQTKLLMPGESDVLRIQLQNEMTFNYYDIADGKELLGTIRSVQVTPIG